MHCSSKFNIDDTSIIRLGEIFKYLLSPVIDKRGKSSSIFLSMHILIRIDPLKTHFAYG